MEVQSGFKQRGDVLHFIPPSLLSPYLSLSTELLFPQRWWDSRLDTSLEPRILYMQ